MYAHAMFNPGYSGYFSLADVQGRWYETISGILKNCNIEVFGSVPFVWLV
jgi:hypothetical protein